MAAILPPSANIAHIQNQPFLSAAPSEALRQQHRPTAPITSQVEVAPGIYIHVEESGNPNGIPAVFFHGGPGIRFQPTDHQWFDPDKYRIIVFQQRGTWNCHPSAFDLETNSQVFRDVTILTLAEDIERLREHLKIEKWLVFGGSWGSTLSLYYAQQFPERCSGVVIRGVYTATPRENALLFEKERMKRQCGEHWKEEILERLLAYARSKGLDARLEDPATIYSAYRELCVERDDRIAQRMWTGYEDYLDDPTDPDAIQRVLSDDLDATPADRSCSIWETLMFDELPRTVNLLDETRLAALRHIPVKIVQGERDNLCHHSIAEDLARRLSAVGGQVDYTLVPGAPHSPYDPPMTDALIRATDSFADNGRFSPPAPERSSCLSWLSSLFCCR